MRYNPEITLVKNDLKDIVDDARRIIIAEGYTQTLNNDEIFAAQVIEAVVRHALLYGVQSNISGEWINNDN